MKDSKVLGEMFMDMSKANEWASKMMAPDGKFFKEQLSTRTDTSEFGWTTEEPKFVSIYQFSGKNPGKNLGMEIYNASVVMGVKTIKKEHSGSGIKYRHYPEAWLEMWFRDFDAKLSVDVYNRQRAKEALNRINNERK